MFNRSLTPFGAAFTPPIEQSLTFDGAAYLLWTPSVAGNRRTWTFATWVRLASFGTDRWIFTADISPLDDRFYFNTSNQLVWIYGGTGANGFTSTAVFRDVGWYHIALVVDTNNATALDRSKLYVNGQRIVVTNGGTPASQDTTINSTNPHGLGHEIRNSATTTTLAMADVHFIDGTALSQAQIQSTFLQDWPFDGQSIPAPQAVSGLTYGTNGFHLAFADTSAFGDDTSGNGNDWTPTGFVAGDQTADVPGRPYSLWSPIVNGTGTISDGGRTSGGNATSTLFMETGQFYWEITANAASVVAGVISDGGSATTTSVANGTTSGFRFDADTGALDVTTDGTNYTPVGTGLTGGRYARASGGSNTINSGLTAFTYTPPTGFLPLSTDNLPTPLYAGKNWQDVLLWSGNATNARNVTGAAFTPDFMMGKARNQVSSWYWADAVRGLGTGDSFRVLDSTGTAAEYTTEDDQVRAFINGGFTVDSNSPDDTFYVNRSGDTYAALLMKANGTGVANTGGTISSTVSVAAAGHFSIVGYTGTGANATVGHGLPDAPECIIIKNRDQADAWAVYHSGVAADAETDYLVLNSTAAAVDDATYWQDTAPTSSVFSIGTAVVVNTNTEDYIAYCFRSVPGLCKVGSYTGNGSADGPLIWLGFKPAFFMWKRTDSTSDWVIADTILSPNNVVSNGLRANTTDAEGLIGNGNYLDLVSNGSKFRESIGFINASGGTYIYLAMADIAGGGDLPWPLAR